MPLPKRKKGETHPQFIERCMSNRTMVKEFPDAAQRRAVCEDQARFQGTEALSLFCEPGALVIEAAADGETATDGNPDQRVENRNHKQRLMDCIFEKTAAGKWECLRCHARYDYLPVRQCDADPEKPKPPPPEPPPSTAESTVPIARGPGDYLHDAILRWVGESPTGDCQCRSRIAQMNAWGPQGCASWSIRTRRHCGPNREMAVI